MNIIINKTIYKIKSETEYLENGFNYVKLEIVKANTVKVLIYNKELNQYTLLGNRYGRNTMTIPNRVLRLVA